MNKTVTLTQEQWNTVTAALLCMYDYDNARGSHRLANETIKVGMEGWGIRPLPPAGGRWEDTTIMNDREMYAELDERASRMRTQIANEYRTTRDKLRQMANVMQELAVIDRNLKRKALRTKAVQSMLRLAQSRVMRDLALYGD